MQKNTPITLKCPSCAKEIVWSEDFPERPFCSERCRLIDLGEWASEGHKIPGAPLNTAPNIEDDDF